MGTAVDAIDDDRIYTFHPDIFPLAKKNRTLLYAVMSEAGFVNAPVEWWHYSYGDQDWALRTGHSMAIYDVCTAEKVS
jgi:D-alanyl-D-alanine dipeptidase